MFMILRRFRKILLLAILLLFVFWTVLTFFSFSHPIAANQRKSPEIPAIFEQNKRFEKLPVDNHDNDDDFAQPDVAVDVDGLPAAPTAPASFTSHRRAANVTQASAQTGVHVISTTKSPALSTLSSSQVVIDYTAHIFYYAWYGNPVTDGRWVHWNHPRLSHWHEANAKMYDRSPHKPPDDIGANFYPELGPYSSKNPETIQLHMQAIRSAGLGVLVVSWYPPGKKDDNGKPVDELIPLLLDAAGKNGLKVALHIEPYNDRNIDSLFKDFRYIYSSYNSHPAYYKHTLSDGRKLPMIYIYDSYKIHRTLWQSLLTERGTKSIRGKPFDALVIGLVLTADCAQLKEAGFDGVYTYFAADGFTFASSATNWAMLAEQCRKNGIYFIPSVGPGYQDTSVRPWNYVNERLRDDGKYYAEHFRAGLKLGTKFISITSFNEWHEGTQIEGAVPKPNYMDYGPRSSSFYLKLTKKFLARRPGVT